MSWAVVLGWVHALLARRFFVMGCIVLAIVLRLAWIMVLDVKPISDFGWYYERGRMLAAGQGYSVDAVATAYWPIGYPAFLGLLFWLFGLSVFVAQLANVVLYVGIIALSYLIAKTIFLSEAVARLTLFLLAVYPNHIAYSAILASETPFLLLSLLGVWLLLRARISFQHSLIVAAGVVFGLAALIRPPILLLPMLLLWGCFRERQQLVQVLRSGAILYLSLSLILVPWTIRNFAVFKRVVVVSTNGGINLLIGNNPYATGGYIWNNHVRAPLNGIQNEYERNKVATTVAVRYIAHHPWHTIMLWPKKLRYLYLTDDEGVRYVQAGIQCTGLTTQRLLRWARGIANSFYIIVMLLSVRALVIEWRRKTDALRMLGWVTILYYTVVYLIFFGDSRFHFQNMPWIMMYAAVTAVTWLEPRIGNDEGQPTSSST